KIGLSSADLWLAGVPVHRNEVTGISAQHHVCSLFLRPTSDLNHLPNIKEMVGRESPRVVTSSFGFLNDPYEVLPVRVCQNLHNIACIPERKPLWGDPHSGI